MPLHLFRTIHSGRYCIAESVNEAATMLTSPSDDIEAVKGTERVLVNTESGPTPLSAAELIAIRGKGPC